MYTCDGIGKARAALNGGWLAEWREAKWPPVLAATNAALLARSLPHLIPPRCTLLLLPAGSGGSPRPAEQCLQRLGCGVRRPAGRRCRCCCQRCWACHAGRQCPDRAAGGGPGGRTLLSAAAIASHQGCRSLSCPLAARSLSKRHSPCMCAHSCLATSASYPAHLHTFCKLVGESREQQGVCVNAS